MLEHQWVTKAGYAGKALATRTLALSVARHKAAFLREGRWGQWIEYRAVASSGLQLISDGFARESLAEDYDRMVSDGMLLDYAEPFDLFIKRCADFEARANDV